MANILRLSFMTICVGIIEPLFWCGMRLNFLRENDEVLLRYDITDPTKERLHARLAELLFFGTIICIFLGWMLSVRFFVPVGLCIYMYAVLTIIFYLNRRDDPVANGWG